MTSKLDFNSIISELRALDMKDTGSWSVPVRAIVVAFCCLTLGFFGYWLLIRDQFGVLDQAVQKETELRSSFESKQRKVANLDAYKVQLQEMELAFGNLLRQLPGETEIANLLQDISQTRVSVGLEEQLFRPEAERPKEFYAEAPITLTVSGNYHQFAEFASGIASLPRIVTLNNIEIKSVGTTGSIKDVGDKLIMNTTAITYRYVDRGDGKPATDKPKQR
jgi:type IV pilus assembly protein PilO